MSVNKEQQNIQEQQELNEMEDEIIEKIPTNTEDFKIKKYKKGRFLGKGGFAFCYELIDEETNHLSAAKIIPKKKLN